MRFVTLKLRLSFEQLKLLQHAATLQGIGVADFARQAAYERAHDIARGRHRIRAIRARPGRSARRIRSAQGGRRFASWSALRQRWYRSAATERSIAEARLVALAWKQIIDGADWLAVETLGESACQWLQERRTFCLRIGGVDCVPAYTLDAYRCPLPQVSEILKTLDWESTERVAAWFESTSAFLGGRRPRELIRQAPSRVIAAAHDQRAAEDI